MTEVSRFYKWGMNVALNAAKNLLKSAM